MIPFAVFRTRSRLKPELPDEHLRFPSSYPSPQRASGAVPAVAGQPADESFPIDPVASNPSNSFVSFAAAAPPVSPSRSEEREIGQRLAVRDWLESFVAFFCSFRLQHQ